MKVVDNMITTVARAVRSIFPGVMLSQVISKVRKFNIRVESFTGGEA